MYHNSIKRIRFIQDEIAYDQRHTQSLLNDNTTTEYQGVAKHSKNSHGINHHGIKRVNPSINNNALTKIKENLHCRAQRKVTRIASWNINNGFDHLAIATIMAKNDIDILAIQEPRTSNSVKDDVWIATMKKELRNCKYELLTSKFSYLVFDEQPPERD